MAARRLKSLLQGGAKGVDGIQWHREHRSKKGRIPKKRFYESSRKRLIVERLNKKYKRLGGWPDV